MSTNPNNYYYYYYYPNGYNQYYQTTAQQQLQHQQQKQLTYTASSTSISNQNPTESTAKSTNEATTICSICNLPKNEHEPHKQHSYDYSTLAYAEKSSKSNLTDTKYESSSQAKSEKTYYNDDSKLNDYTVSGSYYDVANFPKSSSYNYTKSTTSQQGYGSLNTRIYKALPKKNVQLIFSQINHQDVKTDVPAKKTEYVYQYGDKNSSNFDKYLSPQSANKAYSPTPNKKNEYVYVYDDNTLKNSKTKSSTEFKAEEYKIPSTKKTEYVYEYEELKSPKTNNVDYIYEYEDYSKDKDNQFKSPVAISKDYKTPESKKVQYVYEYDTNDYADNSITLNTIATSSNTQNKKAQPKKVEYVYEYDDDEINSYLENSSYNKLDTSKYEYEYEHGKSNKVISPSYQYKSISAQDGSKKTQYEYEHEKNNISKTSSSLATEKSIILPHKSENLFISPSDEVTNTTSENYESSSYKQMNSNLKKNVSNQLFDDKEFSINIEKEVKSDATVAEDDYDDYDDKSSDYTSATNKLMSQSTQSINNGFKLQSILSSSNKNISKKPKKVEFMLDEDYEKEKNASTQSLAYRRNGTNPKRKNDFDSVKNKLLQQAIQLNKSYKPPVDKPSLAKQQVDKPIGEKDIKIEPSIISTANPKQPSRKDEKSYEYDDVSSNSNMKESKKTEYVYEDTKKIDKKPKIIQYVIEYDEDNNDQYSYMDTTKLKTAANQKILNNNQTLRSLSQQESLIQSKSSNSSVSNNMQHGYEYETNFALGESKKFKSENDLRSATSIPIPVVYENNLTTSEGQTTCATDRNSHHLNSNSTETNYGIHYNRVSDLPLNNSFRMYSEKNVLLPDLTFESGSKKFLRTLNFGRDNTKESGAVSSQEKESSRLYLNTKSESASNNNNMLQLQSTKSELNKKSRDDGDIRDELNQIKKLGIKIITRKLKTVLK